jgi:hypothetical protein
MIIVKAKSIDGTFANVSVSSGSVKVDRTSQDARRTCSLTINDPTLVPIISTDPLGIYGNHLYIYRGVLWNMDGIGEELFTSPPPLTKELRAPANGAYELVPLGVFRISSVDITEDTQGDITISVDGADISSNISKNAWTNPVTVWKTAYRVPVPKTSTTAEQTYVANTMQEALKLLINDRWSIGKKSVFGETQFNFSGVADMPLARPVIMGSANISTSGSNSPWVDFTGLATSLGAELFIDADGAFTLKRLPDPNTIPPIWSFLDGEGGLLTNAQRKLDVDKAINYVIATGENTGAKQALKAIAFDGDPASPTYYQGEFGRVVGRESGRKKLTTQAQVQNAADTYLNWFVGGEEAVTIEGIVNPGLDTGDVVLIRRKAVGIYNPYATLAELSSPLRNDGSSAISEILTTPLKKPLAKGTKVVLYTYSAEDVVTVASHYPAGATDIQVEPFFPKVEYYKSTPVLDTNDTSNNGAVPYYIDQLTIPLDLDSPVQITARSRRVGSKQDAIRVAEYQQN